MIVRLPKGHLKRVAGADKFHGSLPFRDYGCEVELDENELIKASNKKLGKELSNLSFLQRIIWVIKLGK